MESALFELSGSIGTNKREVGFIIVILLAKLELLLLVFELLDWCVHDHLLINISQ